MKKILISLSLLAVLALISPSVTHATTPFDLGNTDFGSLVIALIYLVNDFIILLEGLAIVVFIWSLIKFLPAEADSKKREEWRAYMFYGILTFVIIGGFWGLVNLSLSAFGIGGGSGPVIPQFSTSGSQSAGSCGATGEAPCANGCNNDLGVGEGGVCQ